MKFNVPMLAASSALPAVPAVTATAAAYWTLRIGAALCFIGHGAFGFITKAAWVQYFAVIGIPESWAWKLMPLVGAVDVMAGMAVLFAPRGLPLVYMTVWALWTALLRPLAGESVFEAVERAGNYGVPFVFLLLTGMPRSFRDLMTPRQEILLDERSVRFAQTALKWTTSFVLLGHGALSSFTGKLLLREHYTSIGLPDNAALFIGCFEIALAVAVLIRPMIGMLLFIAAWKLATEFLFIVAGSPVWEVVERAGSIAAPIALACLITAFRPPSKPA